MSQKFAELLDVVAALRSETGCPWDRKQTIESMLPHLESEVAEVREAVEKADLENLAEELGDTLLNLAMISQIASEEGKFSMEDVLTRVIEKVKSRHTWVFGPDAAKVKTAEDALRIWQENKKKEKSDD